MSLIAPASFYTFYSDVFSYTKLKVIQKTMDGSFLDRCVRIFYNSVVFQYYQNDLIKKSSETFGFQEVTYQKSVKK